MPARSRASSLASQAALYYAQGLGEGEAWTMALNASTGHSDASVKLGQKIFASMVKIVRESQAAAPVERPGRGRVWIPPPVGLLGRLGRRRT
jgi:hypothetical protein